MAVAAAREDDLPARAAPAAGRGQGRCRVEVGADKVDLHRSSRAVAAIGRDRPRVEDVRGVDQDLAAGRAVGFRAAARVEDQQAAGVEYQLGRVDRAGDLDRLPLDFQPGGGIDLPFQVDGGVGADGQVVGGVEVGK